MAGEEERRKAHAQPPRKQPTKQPWKNHLECNWIKCSNKEIELVGGFFKARFSYILPT